MGIFAITAPRTEVGFSQTSEAEQAPAGGQPAPGQAAAGAKTPTYLSNESLTFSSAAVVGSTALVVVQKIMGADHTNWVAAVVISIVVAALVTAFGLLSEATITGKEIAKATILGIFNTVILMSSMVGVSAVFDISP